MTSTKDRTEWTLGHYYELYGLFLGSNEIAATIDKVFTYKNVLRYMKQSVHRWAIPDGLVPEDYE